MKVKALLCTAFALASLSASASYPLTFRDCGGTPDLTTMDYPVVEGTSSDTKYGDPLFNEDGSITLTSNEKAVGGIWYRTIAVNGESVPEEYTVFAVDYKSNRDVEMVLIPQEGWGNAGISQKGSSGYLKTDEWLTCYVPFRTGAFANWGTGQKSYFWVSTNDDQGKTPGWELTVKNIRLLTLAEAAEECKGADVAVINEQFSQPNLDFTKDVDPDMDNDPIYVFSEMENPNPILQVGPMVRPLSAKCTTFCFDYKLVGEPYAPAIHFVQGGLPFHSFVGPTMETVEDQYAEDYKVFSIDLADKIKEYSFASTFGSNDILWLQFMTMNKDNILYAKNPRWIDPNAEVEDPAGVAEIGVAERPADNRVFNIMGVEVKGELAPGLYIQNGKKFIVK